jgi:hypothetical protein
MSAIKGNINRETLFHHIISIIGKWPELDRSIFCESHYYAHSPETIACSFGLEVNEVRKKLSECNRRLHASLGDSLQKLVADPSFNIDASGNIDLALPILMLKKKGHTALRQG